MADIEFEQQVQSESATFLSELLNSENKLLTVVLQSHLKIERSLTEAIAVFLCQPGCLDDARLNFAQKIHLTRALNLHHPNEPLWAALRALNRLRNDLAHQLTSQQRDNLIAEFIRLTESDFKDKSDFQRPPEIIDQLFGCLAYIFGCLRGILGDYELRASLLHQHNAQLAERRGQEKPNA